MKRTFLIIALMPLLLAGCPRRVADEEVQVFKHQKAEHVLALVIDMSSSFAYSMQEDDPRAFRFLLNVIDKFKQERAGNNDRIVIAQLSGSDKPLLFDGKPGDLKRAFTSQDQFKQCLTQKSDHNGSKVYASIDKTLTYLNQRVVADPETRITTIVLSDLLDNDPDEQAKQKMIATLQRYAPHGAIGFYWVDQTKTQEFSDILQQAGYPPATWSHIQYDPPLPSFTN